MGEKVKNRTIRPSTRNEKSKSYKIDTRQVCAADSLVVNITHESKPFRKSYRFMGKDVDSKNSISFRVYDYGNKIDITWSGAIPIEQFLESEQIIKSKLCSNIIHKKSETKIKAIEKLKMSFDPISNTEIEVLILGSIPGDKSIGDQEYYAHPRNRFWRIISSITANELPKDYKSKIELLLKNKIGVWDVAHTANRKGSLDINIKDEMPNDLESLIYKSKKLKIIAFNGSKSAKMFNKYFIKKADIKYILLPSSSPANASKSFEQICRVWQQLTQ